MRLYALLLTFACVCFGQGGGTTNLIGTAINTTNPDSPVAAPVTIRLADGSCTLTISAPLVGSGSCLLKSYDEKTGRIEIISAGAVSITWSGTVKGNFASGSYKIESGHKPEIFISPFCRLPKRLQTPRLKQSRGQGQHPIAVASLRSSRPSAATLMAGTEKRSSSLTMGRYGSKQNTTIRIFMSITPTPPFTRQVAAAG